MLLSDEERTAELAALGLSHVGDQSRRECMRKEKVSSFFHS